MRVLSVDSKVAEGASIVRIFVTNCNSGKTHATSFLCAFKINLNDSCNQIYINNENFLFSAFHDNLLQLA